MSAEDRGGDGCWKDVVSGGVLHRLEGVLGVEVFVHFMVPACACLVGSR